MKAKFYTGVGSRKTPPHILKVMRQLATKLNSDGWVLRSGGADGADTAFEQGSSVVSPPLSVIYRAMDATQAAMAIAAKAVPTSPGDCMAEMPFRCWEII
jgi:hypothetical protein